MNSYARVQDGVVLEVLATDQEIGGLFHPDLVWIGVPEERAVAPGWRHDGSEFIEPPAAPDEAEALSLHGVMAALSEVKEQLAIMKRSDQ